MYNELYGIKKITNIAVKCLGIYIGHDKEECNKSHVALDFIQYFWPILYQSPTAVCIYTYQLDRWTATLYASKQLNTIEFTYKIILKHCIHPFLTQSQKCTFTSVQSH